MAVATRKTVCPVSRKEFRENAKDLEIRVGDRVLYLRAKEFSTNSLGWGANEKVTLTINGKAVTVQVGINFTVVGSKELPQS